MRKTKKKKKGFNPLIIVGIIILGIILLNQNQTGSRKGEFDEYVCCKTFDKVKKEYFYSTKEPPCIVPGWNYSDPDILLGKPVIVDMSYCESDNKYVMECLEPDTGLVGYEFENGTIGQTYCGTGKCFEGKVSDDVDYVCRFPTFWEKYWLLIIFGGVIFLFVIINGLRRK